MASTSKPANPKQEPASCSVNFPQKGKVQPKGFSELSLGDEVTITVKGKVKSVSMDEYTDGYGGKRLSVDISSCIIGNSDEDGVVKYSS